MSVQRKCINHAFHKISDDSGFDSEWKLHFAKTGNVPWSVMIQALNSCYVSNYGFGTVRARRLRAQMISVPQMTANDPRPEMIPANGVVKYREWRGLHEKSMDVYLLWMYIYCLIFLP